MLKLKSGSLKKKMIIRRCDGCEARMNDSDGGYCLKIINWDTNKTEIEMDLCSSCRKKFSKHDKQEQQSYL